LTGPQQPAATPSQGATGLVEGVEEALKLNGSATEKAEGVAVQVNGTAV
jgi:hypothetical protein